MVYAGICLLCSNHNGFALLDILGPFPNSLRDDEPRRAAELCSSPSEELRFWNAFILSEILHLDQEKCQHLLTELERLQPANQFFKLCGSCAQSVNKIAVHRQQIIEWESKTYLMEKEVQKGMLEYSAEICGGGSSGEDAFGILDIISVYLEVEEEQPKNDKEFGEIRNSVPTSEKLTPGNRSTETEHEDQDEAAHTLIPVVEVDPCSSIQLQTDFQLTQEAGEYYGADDDDDQHEDRCSVEIELNLEGGPGPVDVSAREEEVDCQSNHRGSDMGEQVLQTEYYESTNECTLEENDDDDEQPAPHRNNSDEVTSKNGGESYLEANPSSAALNCSSHEETSSWMRMNEDLIVGTIVDSSTELPKLQCGFCEITFFSSHYFSQHMEQHTTMSREAPDNPSVRPRRSCRSRFQWPVVVGSPPPQRQKNNSSSETQEQALPAATASSSVRRKTQPRSSSSTSKKKCPICKKLFGSDASLKVHMKLHAGGERFKCNLCSKGFSKAGNLWRHVNGVHYDRKTHQCEICEKAFCRTDAFQDHVRTHTNERPYKCSICHKTFSKQSNFCVHRQQYHGGRGGAITA